MRRAFAILTTIALGGCVFLIDPIETNDHCGIAGAGPCAECIRSNCTTPIDACCASTDCSASSILSDIDACGRDEVDACFGTLTSGRITKTEEAVRFCASAKCRNACTVGASSTGKAPRPQWTCATPREPVNACATCIYDSCGDKLDSCCGDSSCKDDTTIQVDLGACVSGDAKGCAYSQTDARSTSGQAGVVRACILDKCKSCIGNGTTHTDCSLLNGGKYCQCSSSEVAGDQSCKASDFGGDCFETKKGCACGVFGCTESSTGCSCSFTGGGSPTPCDPQLGSSSSSGSSSDPVCCIKISDSSISCECREYQTKCYNDLDEYDVARCSIDAVRAALSSLQTPTCSR